MLTARNLLTALMMTSLSLMVACGDDDDDDTADGGMEMDAEIDAAADASTIEAGTIADLLTTSTKYNFSMLLDAIDTANLLALVDEETDGPLTVFAPSNDATGIDMLPTAAADLATAIGYHVVAGDLTPDETTFLPTSATDAAGNNYSLYVWVDNTGTSPVITLNSQMGDAVVYTVVDTIDANNGVIHVIDRVLDVPNIAEMATAAGFTELLDAVGNSAGEGLTDIAGLLGDDADVITLLAPNNAAFLAAETALGGDLEVEFTAAEINSILQLHVLDLSGTAPVLAADVPNGTVTTANGEDLTTTAENLTADPMVQATFAGDGNDSAATVVAAGKDIVVENGVIHEINAVLLPAPPSSDK